ncbi:MAG TPA: hypothetical protein VLA43_21480, partial [Longimicrobiales bacterium]|nr:hypothetical protein [Longimicrobiales bacterium]
MSRRHDRRYFLRALAGAAGAVALGGCGADAGGGRTEGGGSSEGVPDGERIARPLVRPRGADAVWIAGPTERRPAAYVSMERRQVFVDRTFRDRASWLLDAHISVSTGLWRIPLPGDSPRTPISPGDEAREFEELAIGAWDPSTVPAVGDIRILLGVRAPWVVPAGCLPVQGTGEWLATERLEHDRCRPGSADTVREDFLALGSGRRYADRGCADAGRDVTVYG